MFTGIVEELGDVVERDGDRLRIACTTVLDDVALGASIAVNGCCLTVVAFDGGWWDAELTDETWSRTSLGDLAAGDRVNLERPVRLADRLGGHLVQGHVDGVGEIVDPAPDLRVRCARDLLRYVVEKGSITVDGISLTVVDAARRRLHRRRHPAHGGRHDARPQGRRRAASTSRSTSPPSTSNACSPGRIRERDRAGSDRGRRRGDRPRRDRRRRRRRGPRERGRPDHGGRVRHAGERSPSSCSTRPA